MSELGAKVALLTDTVSADSGWGRYTVELMTRLPDFGIHPVVLAPPQGDDTCSYEPVLRRLDRRSRLPFWFAGSVHASYSIVRSCDLVHVLVEQYAPVGAFLSRSCPFLFNVYGTYAVKTLKDWWFRPLMRWAIRRADRIVAMSCYTERRLRALAPSARTCIIRSGVDTTTFEPGPGWKAGDGRVILSVGAVKPRKGHDILLAAFSRVAGEFPDATWTIVGDVSQRPGFVAGLRREIARLGLGDRVVFKCRVSQSELVKLYQTCYLFALAPRNVGDHFEGYGLVYSEANACARPIIATRDNGSEETVRDGFNGLLVNQNDVEGTERALRWLLKHPEEAIQMGLHGRQMVELLTWDRAVGQFVECYRELLGRA